MQKLINDLQSMHWYQQGLIALIAIAVFMILYAAAKISYRNSRKSKPSPYGKSL